METALKTAPAATGKRRVRFQQQAAELLRKILPQHKNLTDEAKVERAPEKTYSLETNCQDSGSLPNRNGIASVCV